MQTPWSVKALVIAALLAVIASLGIALVHLMFDRGRSARMVKALTLRIGMSLLLFVLVVAGMLSGVIVPHGVAP